MNSRLAGRFSRPVAALLAALFAAAVPATALAGETDSTPSTEDSHAAAPAHKARHGKKHAHVSKDKEAKDKDKSKDNVPSLSAAAPQDKEEKEPAKAKAAPVKPVAAANAKGKKSKKSASRASKKKTASKKGDGKAPPRSVAKDKPCFGPSVAIDRGGLEGESFPLLTCKGAPAAVSRERLSMLARPWSVARPELPKGHRANDADDAELAPGVHLLDPGLLARIDSIAHKFPGRTVSIVSGYRPQSRGSLHQAGRAIDLRVAGVKNEELVAFCRSLLDSGCGYYPNSSFVHVDVRNPGSGSVTWIDASGPGEAPRYVTEWPPKSDAPTVVPPADSIDDEFQAHRGERGELPIDGEALPTREPARNRWNGPLLLPSLDPSRSDSLDLAP